MTNQEILKEEVHNTSSLNELFAALAKAQTEMEVSSLNSSNPFFKSKYADLASVIKASRPYLSKNGLAVIQQILSDDQGTTHLHTKLCHSSGQWIESKIKIVPAKNDVQSLGSYITYLKRYSYAALVGVVSSDEDDDGEAAVPVKEKEVQKIAPQQLLLLQQETQSYEDIVQQIKNSLNIKDLADLPQDKFEASLRRVRQIKQQRSSHAHSISEAK